MKFPARIRVLAALAVAILVGAASAMPAVSPISILGTLTYVLSPEFEGQLPKRARRRLTRLEAKLRQSDDAPYAAVVSLTRKAAKAMVPYQNGDDAMLRMLQRSTATLIEETTFNGCVLQAVVENDETHWVGRDRVLAKLARVQVHCTEAARLLETTLPAVGAKDPGVKAHKRALREVQRALKLNARATKAIAGNIGIEMDQEFDPTLEGSIAVRQHLPGTGDPGLETEGARVHVERVEGTSGNTVWSFRIVLGDTLAHTTRVIAIDVPQTGPFLTGLYTPGDGSGATGGFQDPYRIHSEWVPFSLDLGVVQYDESDLTMSFYVEIHAINDYSRLRIAVDATDIPIH